ncbi:DUF4189 domain-containing protein [Nocardia sp. NPDC052566]|uniref:DUF4189 domain-containing protein n=1 Tax=Nocardia sp. NPDC052566 TaxID=3364330 RepID=UPI0037C760C8
MTGKSTTAHPYRRITRLVLGAAILAAPLATGSVAQASSTNYGAIAVSSRGAWGWAVDYATSSLAESWARSRCGHSDCTVLVSFSNSCGAVADGGRKYYGGHGSTRAAAERNALARAGGGSILTWACTTRPY